VGRIRTHSVSGIGGQNRGHVGLKPETSRSPKRGGLSAPKKKIKKWGDQPRRPTPPPPPPGGRAGGQLPIVVKGRGQSKGSPRWFLGEVAGVLPSEAGFRAGPHRPYGRRSGGSAAKRAFATADSWHVKRQREKVDGNQQKREGPTLDRPRGPPGGSLASRSPRDRLRSMAPAPHIRGIRRSPFGPNAIQTNRWLWTAGSGRVSRKEITPVRTKPRARAQGGRFQQGRGGKKNREDFGAEIGGRKMSNRSSLERERGPGPEGQIPRRDRNCPLLGRGTSYQPRPRRRLAGKPQNGLGPDCSCGDRRADYQPPADGGRRIATRATPGRDAAAERARGPGFPARGWGQD